MIVHDYKFSPWRVQKDQRVVVGESTWRHLPKWDWAAKAAGERRRVLVVVDVFEGWTGPMVDAAGATLHSGKAWGVEKPWHAVGDIRIGKSLITIADVRRRLFAIIDATPNLDWLLVTKLPENVGRMLLPYDGHYVSCEHDGIVPVRPNVWLGTSVENQEQAGARIPHLLKTPAAVRFLSCEPLLGPLDLSPWLITDVDARDGNLIDWVIVGGESGPGTRPMHPDWARSIRDQCVNAGVPFFFKGWGEWAPFDNVFTRVAGESLITPFDLPRTVATVEAGGVRMACVGKKASVRLLDGREWNGFPKVGGGS